MAESICLFLFYYEFLKKSRMGVEYYLLPLQCPLTASNMVKLYNGFSSIELSLLYNKTCLVLEYVSGFSANNLFRSFALIS